jgi:hypothetical protein
VLAIVCGTAVDAYGEPTATGCLACRGPWGTRRRPLATVIVEALPLDRVLTGGICGCCAKRRDARVRIYAGLERILGLNPATARPFHEEVRA